MKIIDYKCDIHKCDFDVGEKFRDKAIQVTFTTEQTEGRSIEPYLAVVTIDICEGCYNKLVKGAHIFASGAQGYNIYTIGNQE